MRNMMLCFFVLLILGIVFLAGQGSANTLDSSTELNKIGALKIFDDSGKTMLDMDLGEVDDITSITLKFYTEIENNTVNISLTNGNDLEIGVGSVDVIVSTKEVTISLSDTVTSIERGTLKNVNISIS